MHSTAAATKDLSTPIIPLYDPTHPEGTPAAVRALYFDLQQGVRTDNTAFFDAAFGSASSSSDLYQHWNSTAQYYDVVKPEAQNTYKVAVDTVTEFSAGDTRSFIASVTESSAVIPTKTSKLNIILGSLLNSAGQNQYVISNITNIGQ